MLSNYLIKGSGNIAQRHAINLKKNSKNNKVFFFTNNKTNKFKNFCKKNKFISNKNIENFNNLKIKAIFICSPSPKHMQDLKKLSNLSQNFFIEKPLSDTLAEALKILKYKKKLIFIGYNLLYDEKLLYLKKLIKNNKKKFGKLYNIECNVGQCLKAWRKDKNYKNTVSAKKSLGGGVLLELSHEINYLCWLFGRPKKISSNIQKISQLKIDVEDYAVHQIIFKENLNCNLKMDFIRKDKKRTINLVFENSTVCMDFIDNYIKIISNDKIKKIYFRNSFNDPYKDQLKSFLNSMKSNKKDPNLKLALDTLNIIKYSKISNNDYSKMTEIKYAY